MPSFDAGKIEGTSGVDRSGFTRDLQQMKADAAKATEKPIVMKATLDDSDVRRKLDQLKQRINSSRGEGFTIKVGLDDSGVKAQLAAIKAQVDRAKASTISMRVEVAGSAAALSSLAAIEAAVNRLDGRDVNIRVSVSNAAANAALEATRLRAERLGSMDPTIRPHVDPAGQRQVDNFAKSLADLGGKIPALLAGIVTLAPALVPLSAALAAAAGGLTSMAVAGGGVAALFGLTLKSAITGAATDAKAYATAQQNVAKAEAAVAGTKAGTAARTAALKQLAEAQQALTKATAAYTPAERSWTTSLDASKTAWTSFVHATSADTLGPASIVLKAFSDNIGKFKPVLDALRPVVTAVADAFARWAAGPGMAGFIGFLTRSGVPILRNFEAGIRNLLGVAGRANQVFAPFGVSISAAFLRVTQSLQGWAEGSNGGPGGFQRFMAYVHQVGPGVQSFLSQLGAAMKNIGTAMKDLGPATLLTLTGFLKAIAGLPPAVLATFILFLGAFKLYSVGFTLFSAVAAAMPARLVAWAGAQWGLNAAMSANVIALIVIGIAALVAGIVWVATKTHWFQDVWQGMTTGIRVAWDATWKFIKQIASDAWGFLTGKWGYLIAVIGPIGWLIAIGTHWSQVWNGVKAVASVVWGWIQTAWHYTTNFILSVVNGMINQLKGIWNAGWNWVKSSASTVWGWLQTAWNYTKNFIIAVVNGLISGVKGVWNAGWGWVRDTASNIWKQIQGAFQQFGRTVGAIWQAFVNGVKTAAQTVWNAVMTAVHTFQASFKQVFTDIVSAVGKTWDGLKKVLAVPINFLIQFVYTDGIKAIWDNTAGKIGLPKMPAAPAPIKYATGGVVPGVGVGDRVNTMLTPGERVLSRDQVASVGGHGTLDQIFGRTSADMRNGTQYLKGGGPVGPKAVKDRAAAVKAKAASGGGFWNPVTAAIHGIKDVAETVIYDVAKPVLNGLKSAVLAHAPAPKDIPVAFANTAITKILSLFKDKQASAVASGGSAGMYASAGAISNFGGVQLDQITINQLKKAFQLAGGQFGLSQGSFSNSVGASAGTHSGGGALDVAGVGGMSTARQIAVVKGLREAGFAAWRRTPSEGFVDHIHAELLGDPLASPEAKAQWPDYFAHKDGLAGHGPDNNPIDVAAGWFGSSAPNSGGSINASGAGDQRGWAKALLQGLGMPQSPANLKFVYDWELSEGGPAQNPLNVGIYSAGTAQPNHSVAAGLSATVQAINQNYYTGIRAALQSSNYNAATAALWSSPWAASHYGYGSRWSGASYASGTSGAAPGLALVGERGPEMVYMQGGETVIPNHVTRQLMGSGAGMRGYANGTLATEIADKLKSATGTVSSRQRTVNSLQDTYDSQRLNAAYAKTAKQRAADLAEEKVTAARLAAAKHQLAQAKQSEAQLKSDYAAATKSQTAAAAAVKAAIATTSSTFTSWLAAEKANLATQLAAAQQLHDSYLSTAQGGAPGLATNTTFASIASSYSGATRTLSTVQANLKTLSSRGLSTGLINAILGMAPADALTYTNGLIRQSGINGANAAFAAYDTAAEAYATTGANIVGNYSNLSAASSDVAQVAITIPFPNKVTIKLADGTTTTGTVTAEEKRIETYLTKVLKTKSR